MGFDADPSTSSSSRFIDGHRTCRTERPKDKHTIGASQWRSWRPGRQRYLRRRCWRWLCIHRVRNNRRCFKGKEGTNGRRFGGNLVEAEYFSEDKYHAKDFNKPVPNAEEPKSMPGFE